MVFSKLISKKKNEVILKKKCYLNACFYTKNPAFLNFAKRGRGACVSDKKR